MIEAIYHELTNRRYITYVGLHGDQTNNLDTFEAITRIMKRLNAGYSSIALFVEI